MAKYEVRCYYCYVGTTIVEADSVEEAYEKGWDICDKMSTDDLQYVNFMDEEVIDEDGFVHEFNDDLMDEEDN